MNQKERMLAGKLYNPYKVDDNTWERNRKALEIFNGLPFTKHKEGMQALREIFGRLPEDANIVPPFYCDKGAQIYIRKSFLRKYRSDNSR